MEMKNKRKNS